MSNPNPLLRVLPVLLVLVSTVTSFGQVATTQTLGSGWGATTQPELVATRPIIGSSMVVAAFKCIPNTESYFFVSAPPTGSATHLGSGLYAQIDLGTFDVFGPVYTDASGTLNFPIHLGLPTNLAGEQAVVQMYVTDPLSPVCVAPQGGTCSQFGFEVTNGLLLTLGLQ